MAHEIKAARLQRLQQLLKSQVNTLTQRVLGSVQRVRVEGVSRKNAHELAGRMDNNRIVNFTGEMGLVGRFVDVRITSTADYTLHGERVAECRS